MISQILSFSVLFLLVFGGVIGVIVKFTLQGNVQANVSNRILEERVESVLGQEDKKNVLLGKKNIKIPA